MHLKEPTSTLRFWSRRFCFWKTTGPFVLLLPDDLLHPMSQHKTKSPILSIFQHSRACVQLRKNKKKQLSPENKREGDHLRSKINKKKATEDTFYQLKVSIDLHLRTTGLNIFLTVVV